VSKAERKYMSAPRRLALEKIHAIQSGTHKNGAFAIGAEQRLAGKIRMYQIEIFEVCAHQVSRAFDSMYLAPEAIADDHNGLRLFLPEPTHHPASSVPGTGVEKMSGRPSSLATYVGSAGSAAISAIGFGLRSALWVRGVRVFGEAAVAVASGVTREVA
jgi:hypothetical protein